ncbi:MAG: DNA polymerase III subunit gamma/tau [Gammaproteobacteria bacterium]|nr:DNA polymerase III subunit gamma/tau [Gammaproteobacteria bacterium]
MKYQVLARKYRPKTFTTMMGQEHVLKALKNALDTERLHHAYLFTGTRGVGKTTVARVLAKALNCEQGVTASPCGECASCQEIDQGRFIDLIEVDAASRTKVEDTRELLDNVQYAPTRGRFKIYLIDEVHMLSGHSFNALLKTLEEPPPHVKFLLATTDPQKLPVTILSRCLQFNLKSLTIEQIEKQLDLILNAEEIPFESTALKPIAIAADGSMRDALSLLDQSIAYSNGKPNLADIELMLGCIQKDRVFELLLSLANGDGQSLIKQSHLLTGQGLDVNTILAELINALQRIALSQMVPDAIDDSLGDKSSVEQMAQLFLPEDVQLYYQIALNGRKDLPFSPQPQGGFDMILLRMLAFKPTGGGHNTKKPNKRLTDTTKPAVNNTSQNTSQQTSNQAGIPSKTPSKSQETTPAMGVEELPPVDAYGSELFTEPSSSAETHHPSMHGQVASSEAHRELNLAHNKVQTQSQPIKKPEALKQAEVKPSPANLADVVPIFGDVEVLEKEQVVTSNQKQVETPCTKKVDHDLADYWHELIVQSGLKGLEQQLAKHCALVNKNQQNNELTLDLLLDSTHRHLLSDKIQKRLIEVIELQLSCQLKVNIKECQVPEVEQFNTPRRREIHEAKVLQEEAVKSIYNDPKVQMIVNSFAAQVREETIKPINSTTQKESK